MDYMSGVIDGAILTDHLVKGASKRSTTMQEFERLYEQEIAYVREKLTRCRANEVLGLLEERA